VSVTVCFIITVFLEVIACSLIEIYQKIQKNMRPTALEQWSYTQQGTTRCW